MPRNIKEIRKSIYSLLESQGWVNTPEKHEEIKKLLQELVESAKNNLCIPLLKASNSLHNSIISLTGFKVADNSGSIQTKIDVEGKIDKSSREVDKTVKLPNKKEKKEAVVLNHDPHFAINTKEKIAPSFRERKTKHFN